ncbi:hypothetical protein PTT_13321 [Pyrenophora teres f. teres 0-1]|uniref:Uncharacterized protein n=1 Tax=Pyrenophora teres f. teres (strain 0-1) TaxID=861557 RepID=E3RVU0_PYRTT|nr:hypothetical protein PTT_13321 [Pyrenophora teres f. teres 0-1]
MAPTSTSSGTPTALPINTQPAPPSGFSGDNFINNLGSDLAPLLTLFGEQVTKQFLTISLGWADNILLAVGPLGIITIIVSAIRVGRVRILKALIGRARESSNLAEVELLSSTSDNSSEIWTYEGVVRLPGKAPVLELIVYGNSEASNPNDVQVGDLGNAYDDDVLEFLPKHVDIQHGIDVSRLSQRLAQQPPNITLNIDKTITSHQETWSFAAFGVALQTVALVIPGIMTYHWKEEKDGGLVQDYAYPTFLVGSLALIIGIALCSHIIEATSVEHMFKLKRPNVKNVMYLQMACTMGDQTFKPYLLIMGHEKDCIRTSRSDGYIAHESPVWFAVVICLLGFVGQFVGLRALHWSATVVQLGVTLIMTATRAWIRRGISRPPEAIPITSTDLDWIALKILQLSLEGKRLTITEIVDLAEDLSELILKHGPVALKSEAMMLVYPTFLREGLLPPVPPERGGQSTSDASSGSGDNHDANRTGPNTESIKSTNISDHSSTGISLNTESSQNTAEAGPSSGDHTNTSDAQSSLDNNHNTSDDVSSPPSPIPQQTNPNPREPSPHPTSIPLTPQQHP